MAGQTKWWFGRLIGDPAEFADPYKVIESSSTRRAHTLRTFLSSASQFLNTLFKWLIYAAAVCGLVWLIVPAGWVRTFLIHSVLGFAIWLSVVRHHETRRFGLQILIHSHLMANLNPVVGDGFIVRQSVPSDADKIAETTDIVVLEANGMPESAVSEIRKHLKKPQVIGAANSITITSDCDEQNVIGSASIHKSKYFENQWDASLSLGPEGRGKGLGTKIILSLAEIVGHHDKDRLIFGTSVDNIAMRRSLERAGAELIKQTPHVVPNGTTMQSAWYQIPTRPGMKLNQPEDTVKLGELTT